LDRAKSEATGAVDTGTEFLATGGKNDEEREEKHMENGKNHFD
jgi:hypothetical protein